jgi:circadian clock protein KaiC
MASDVASLGFDLPELIAAQKLAVDLRARGTQRDRGNGRVRSRGLFVRLDYAIRTVGPNASVPRHIESLFAGLKTRRPPERSCDGCSDG